MSDLAAIKRAIEAMPLEQQESLFVWLSKRLRSSRAEGASPHSVLDIAPVNLGEVIRPLNPEDDLLGEMTNAKKNLTEHLDALAAEGFSFEPEKKENVPPCRF